MPRLTREEIECVFDHLREYAYDMFQLTADDTAPPLTTNGARAILDQIQRLALSALSQEAVRDEASRALLDAICAARDEGFQQGLEKAAKVCEVYFEEPDWAWGERQLGNRFASAIRALKREPNAALGMEHPNSAGAGPAPAAPNRKDWPTPTTANGPISRMPAPAAPAVAEIDRCLKYLSARHFKHDSEISDVLIRCRAALLAKLGQEWVSAQDSNGNYIAGRLDDLTVERQNLDGRIYRLKLPPLPPSPGASDD